MTTSKTVEAQRRLDARRIRQMAEKLLGLMQVESVSVDCDLVEVGIGDVLHHVPTGLRHVTITGSYRHTPKRTRRPAKTR